MANQLEKLRAYPKIQGSHKAPFEECIAFVKYDGSNLHWAWKGGEWVYFGSRRSRYPYTEEGRQEFNKKHAMLSACCVFATSLQSTLSELFQSHFPNSEVVAFTEYLGDRSFAGMHHPDDDMRLVLFDISVDGVFLLPQDFLAICAQIPNVATVVYKGKLNGQFLDDVRSGKYVLEEGVVCKGVARKREGDPVTWMAKVKTNRFSVYAFLIVQLTDSLPDQGAKASDATDDTSIRINRVKETTSLYSVGRNVEVPEDKEDLYQSYLDAVSVQIIILVCG